MDSPTKYLEEGTAIDLFVAYRFLRILTTPWEDQPAFEHGIIDKDGKLLRKANTLNTGEERKSFTLLHRLIFNMKRLLHKIPGVRTKLGTYATALFLLKQHFASLVEEEEMIEKTFSKWLVDNGYMTEEELHEEVFGLGDMLPKGTYKIVTDIIPSEDYPGSAAKGDIVDAFADTAPTDEIMGTHIFTVVHQKTKAEIYVTLDDIEEV